MCSSFILHRRDGTEVEGSTSAELAAAIAPHPLIDHDGNPDEPGNWCICPVNMRATAERAGLACEFSGWDGPVWDMWVLREVPDA